MTFLQLKQLVSFWADDLQMTYFTPEQVGRFLNNAQREVQKLLILAGQDYYLKCAKTQLVINQRDYAFPDDFYKLNRLELIVSGTPPTENVFPLTNITPNQKDLVFDSTGAPSVYYMTKNKLVLLPAPNQPFYLRMLYSYKVADMVSDTDVPDVPEPYQEMIAVLAAMDCFYKDTRDSSALREKRDFYMDMIKRDAAQRAIDASRQVIYTGTYETIGEFIF